MAQKMSVLKSTDFGILQDSEYQKPLICPTKPQERGKRGSARCGTDRPEPFRKEDQRT
jgi:hypothetical protein